jgi:large subunit ribosomal protein L23
MEAHEVLLYPLMGEKATMLREKENTLTFVVAKEASKKDIEAAAKKLLNVEVVGVRVMHTTNGTKKAHIRLDKKHSADEVASHMGVI